jgi:hypothetical protein
MLRRTCIGGRRHVEAGDPRGAGSWLQQGYPHLYRGALAGPVRPKKSEDAPGGDIEVELVNCGMPPEALGELRGAYRSRIAEPGLVHISQSIIV